MDNKKLCTKYRDFFVKISTIFKKELYIYNYSYAFAGEESAKELSGTIVCEISEEYKEILKEFLPAYAYIPSITDFKKDLSLYIEVTKEEIDEVSKPGFKMVDHAIKDVDEYYPFLLSDEVEENEKLFKQFFDDKLLVIVKSPNEGVPPISFGVHFLPMVKASNVQNLYFNTLLYCKLPKETVYEAVFQIQFPYFRIWFQYFYL